MAIYKPCRSFFLDFPGADKGICSIRRYPGAALWEFAGARSFSLVAQSFVW